MRYRNIHRNQIALDDGNVAFSVPPRVEFDAREEARDVQRLLRRGWIKKVKLPDLLDEPIVVFIDDEE